ncbi:MAG: lipopolysaccharide biosynthesis protein [Thiolinea sp.]
MVTLRQLFARDFPVLLAGSLLSSIAQWLLLVYLGRVHGVAVLGQYIWALSLLAPLFMLAALSLRNLIATQAYPQCDFGHYLGLRLLSLSLLLPALLLYSTLSGHHHDLYAFLPLLALLKSVEACSDLYYGRMQQQGQAWLQGLSQVLRFGGGIILFALGAAWGGLYAGFLLLLGGWLLVLLGFDRQRAQAASIRPALIRDRNTLHAVLKSALPLALSSAVGAFVINLPRYALGYSAGDEVLGQFAALTSFTMLLNLIGIALGQSMLSPLSRAFQQHDGRSFLKILGTALALILLTTVVLLVLIGYFGRLLLELTFGPLMADLDQQLWWITLLALPLLPGQIMSYGNMAVRHFSQTFRISLLSAACGTLLSLPLVSIGGIYGAAALFTLSGLIQIAGFGLSMRQAFAALPASSPQPPRVPAVLSVPVKSS